MWVQHQCNNVGPDYFRTIGIPLLRGREFIAADRKGLQSVAIVNESFARAVFGSVDPVGQKISTNKSKLIIGVAKDSKYFTLSEKQRLAVYDPYFAGSEPINLHFLVRTSGLPANYVRPITDTLGRFESTTAIQTKPMSRGSGARVAAEPGRRRSAWGDGSACTHARGDRPLWSAVVFGFAPHSRDRSPHGARSNPIRRTAADRPA